MQRFFFHPDGRLAGSYGGPDAGNPHSGLDFTQMAPEDGQQIWDGTTWTWPLAHLRERKLLAIEERYQAALANGVLFRGKTLQLRPQDQQNLIAKGARAKFVLWRASAPVQVAAAAAGESGVATRCTRCNAYSALQRAALRCNKAPWSVPPHAVCWPVWACPRSR